MPKPLPWLLRFTLTRTGETPGPYDGLAWTREVPDDADLSVVRLSCGHVRVAVRDVTPRPGMAALCPSCGEDVTVAREITGGGS